MKKANNPPQIPATFLFLVLLLLHTNLSFSETVSGMTMGSLKSSELGSMLGRAGAGCAGNGIKCADELQEAEMQMDSEMNRRVLLMQKSYISYETLRRDITPCERPGSSYYNCRSAGVANPYNRGCEVIVGCAKDIRDDNF